jgi:chemotaxis regulatin CheY-phosphate phosphatase CheZ
MAQGYQDITGQIIRSVIALVDELERVLGKLVQIAEGIEVTSLVRSLPTPLNWEQGLGPQVAGIANGDAGCRPGRHRRIAVADGGGQVTG